VVEITRNILTNDPNPVAPLGCTATLAILDQAGTLVTSAPLLVSNIQPATLPAFQGFTGYQISFSITIPDNLLGSPEGLSYTAMMQFSVSHAGGVLDLPAVQEAFSVISLVDQVRGPLPQIVIEGESSAKLSYTYDSRPVAGVVDISLYFGNQSKASYSNILGAGTWDGPTFNYQVDATQLYASLMPHAVLWNIDGVKEIAPIFVINPSVHLAMRELHDFVNKNCSDWATRELTFTPEQLIAALWNGACYFNSEVIATDFSMLNAQGVIRAFWIQCSAVWLMQSQVLNGIETDFSYTNASVTLDVDRASKYQQFASDLENSIRERLTPLKHAMAKRGNVNGDGSAGPLTVRAGALGCVGVSLSPVSKVGVMWNPMSWRSQLLSPGNPAMWNQF
jgi:hypothetical protein